MKTTMEIFNGAVDGMLENVPVAINFEYVKKMKQEGRRIKYMREKRKKRLRMIKQSRKVNR